MRATLVCRFAEMKTYSQLLQDRFALLCCGDKPGVYADIGAGEPELISNTVLLERDYGWTGLLCDIEHQDRLRAERTGVVFGDALEVDWDKELSAIARDGWIDFLSLDLEPPNLTIKVLLMLPLDKIRFRCACVEHDYYRDEQGITRATIVHEVMASHGYRKVRSVKMFYNNDPKSIYLEDWWVDNATDVLEHDVQHMIQDCLSVAT